MRLLVICAAVFVLTSGRKCQNGDENCKSAVSYSDEVDSSHTRHRRGVIVVSKEMKETLTLSSTVTTNLADVKISQNFATTFLNIKPERLVSALKGFSIVASIINAFLEVEDENTKKILNKLDQGFDQLQRKMNSQTAELKAYIDHKFFNTEVVVPVNTVSLQMNIYKNNSNKANKDEFLKQYNLCNIKRVINQILTDAGDILENVIANSKYSKETLNRMCSTITRNFHEAYTIEFFRIGVEFNPTSQKHKDLQETLVGVFKTHRNKLSNIITNATNYLETSFFPGFIGDDIVKVALDRVEGDNCAKASNISDTLHKRFPWRKYAVIVSEEATKPNQYAHFGFDPRKIVVQAYSGKTVIVYMATKNFAKNKEAYELNGERAKIKNLSKDAFRPQNLWTIADLAKQITQYSQMAVHYKGFNPCLRSEDPNVTDSFDQSLYYFDLESQTYWLTMTIVF